MNIDEGLLVTTSLLIIANCIGKAALLRTHEVVCFHSWVRLSEPHRFHDLFVSIGLQTTFDVQHLDGGLLLTQFDDPCVYLDSLARVVIDNLTTSHSRADLCLRQISFLVHKSAVGRQLGLVKSKTRSPLVPLTNLFVGSSCILYGGMRGSRVTISDLP